MAFVKSISELPALHNARPHSDTDCTWRISERHGSRVLQLDTYGSPERKDRGTISQSLQFDEERAVELLEVIVAGFPRLRRR